MSAAENIVSIAPPADSLEVTLNGSRDLRRTLYVERTEWGTICVRVGPQLTHRKRGDTHPGWYERFSSTHMRPVLDRDIEIVYHKHGSINLWLGDTCFKLLPAEADELAAKFGFTVRRESQP